VNRLLAIAIVCFSTPSLWAWGEDGHVIVGRIADAYLKPEVRKKIAELLDHRPIHDTRFVNWADFIRSSAEYGRKYKDHPTWHYINIELKQKAGEYKIDPDGNDVIGAVEKFSKVCVSPDVSKENRKEALFFLLHFIGDLHQPLHCTNRDDDKGGNLQLLKSFNGKAEERLNLHKVWDVHFVNVERGAITVEDFSKRLLAEIEEKQRAEWSTGNVRTWVWDSHEVGLKTLYIFADGTPLPLQKEPPVELTDENYIRKNRPVVREQLKKGGVRLAALLNEVFKD
jgi:S1/P1 Nuclease